MHRWVSSRASAQSPDVDQVAQEVYLRLLRYSDDVLAECPQEYLFRIATHVTNEWHERADTSDEAVPENDEGKGVVEPVRITEEVRAALGRLPPRQREALLLHINEELTYQQVAVRMKLTPRIVRRDIVSAYASLRHELGSAELDAIFIE